MSEQVEQMSIDKSKWPDGPWKTEPDRLQWKHAGYACLIVRGPVGALCGYVGVDNTHPAYEKAYQDVEDNIHVHGGLTYSAKCMGHICHVPEPGMPDDVWWLGFDCAHAGDLAPRMWDYDRQMPPSIAEIEKRHFLRDVYRDIEYVKAQTEHLAEQLRALAQ